MSGGLVLDCPEDLRMRPRIGDPACLELLPGTTPPPALTVPAPGAASADGDAGDGAHTRTGSNGAPPSMNARQTLRTAVSSGTGNRTPSWAHGAGAPQTTVERSCRYLQAARVPDTTAKQTMEAQLGIYRRL